MQRDGLRTRSMERKRKREEDEELLKKCACVQKANEFRKMDEHVFEQIFGDLDDSFVMENKLHRGLKKEGVQEVYSICKTNMEDLYNACSWKWNEKKELAAIRSRANRFLFIRSAKTSAIAAYVMLRFFVDPDDNASVVYIFDIQVLPEHQGKGLGTRLLKAAEALGKAAGIQKCRLTVFKHNPGAYALYVNHMAYEIDPISPSLCGVDECYEILSKPLSV